MNQEKYNPENLYQIYKQSRANTTTESESNDSPQTADEEFIDKVYRDYRQTRNSSEIEIDNIMQVIASTAASPAGVIPQLGHTTIAQDSAPITAANDSSYLLKYVMPAIVATLFAFVLLPFFDSNTDSTDPTADTAYLSADLAAFVEPGNHSTMSFSDNRNNQSTAIKHGILTTDLQVLTRADGHPARVSQVVQSYLLNEQTESESIVLSAQRVVSGAASDSASLTREAAANIQSLITGLAEYSNNNNSFAWYNVGRATESVILASQLALATSNTSPLHSAILHGNSITIPNDNQNLKAQITSLFSEHIQESMPPADLRRILNKAQDIKSVVQ